MNSLELQNIIAKKDYLNLMDYDEIKTLKKIYPYCEILNYIELRHIKLNEPENFNELFLTSQAYISDINRLTQYLENIDNISLLNEHTIDKRYKKNIIEQFIKVQPSITKNDKLDVENNTNELIIDNSVIENEDIYSETLANIYIKQGNFNKAIIIFEKLSVQNPKKILYFAQEIEKLKNI